MELGIGIAHKIDHLEIPRGQIEDRVAKTLEKLKITDYRRQYKIGPYYADFYFPTNRLVLEIDGRDYHTSDKDILRDRRRDDFMIRKGYPVLRITGSIAFRYGGSICSALRSIKLAKFYYVGSDRSVKDFLIFSARDLILAEREQKEEARMVEEETSENQIIKKNLSTATPVQLKNV